MMKLKLRFILW